jgi:hypothetical protein
MYIHCNINTLSLYTPDMYVGIHCTNSLISIKKMAVIYPIKTLGSQIQIQIWSTPKAYCIIYSRLFYVRYLTSTFTERNLKKLAKRPLYIFLQCSGLLCLTRSPSRIGFSGHKKEKIQKNPLVGFSGQGGPWDSKGTLRPDFQANTWSWAFSLKAMSP